MRAVQAGATLARVEISCATDAAGGAGKGEFDQRAREAAGLGAPARPTWREAGRGWRQCSGGRSGSAGTASLPAPLVLPVPRSGKSRQSHYKCRGVIESLKANDRSKPSYWLR